jgi:hypothetical protein
VALVALAAAIGGALLWRGRAGPRQEGVLSVASTPPGAAVSVGGAAQPGATPLIVHALPRGVPLEVEVTKPGYEPWRGRATIPPERGDEQVRATLAPLADAGLGPAPAP